MLFIPNISNDNYQTLVVKNEDGTEFELSLQFSESQSNWFYGISYTPQSSTPFIINGRRLTTGYVLGNYRNQIPFGLVCLSNDNGDPYFLNDFIPVIQGNQFSSRIQLYSLSMVETKEMNYLMSPTPYAKF